MNTDSQHRLVIIVACLGLAALACSDAFTGPSTIDLTGNWLLGYTDSDGAFTCHHDSVFLFFGDSTAMPRAVLLGSTAGYCVGSGRNDTLFFARSSIDSIVVGSGRIRFVTHSGAFQYTGRIVSPDSVDGTMFEDGYYVGLGRLAHLTGTWGAHRIFLGP